MKQSPALNWLVPLIAVLAIIIAAAGIFSGGGEGPHPFTTVYGDTVEIYGHGIYRHDSTFVATLFRGTDVITLFASVPLLLISFWMHRRGSLRGSLFMIGVLMYLFYVGVTYTFSALFNSLFLVYAALFSAGLFAVVVALTAVDTESLAARLSSHTPRRGMAMLLIIAGLGTLMLWFSELIDPLMNGTAPAHLGPYTTMFTHGFDAAVITPATVLAGFLLLQKRSLGYLLAASLLILCTLMGMAVFSQTLWQASEGIIFPVGIYIGMIGSWVAMGAFAVGLNIRFFRSLTENVPPHSNVKHKAFEPATLTKN